MTMAVSIEPCWPQMASPSRRPLAIPIRRVRITRNDAAESALTEAADVVSSRTTAIERVLDRFSEVAMRAGAAHGLRGDDLDEVMQDVRIRIWKAAGDAEKLETLTSSYVYRAAASAAVDILRRRRARREQSIDNKVESDPHLDTPAVESADADLMSAETFAAIERAVDAIPVNRRPVVRMYLKGYEREEIASLLGWSEAKTRNLLYRGLDDLRQRLTVMGIKP
jgi:RNA polymerase sigma-70 factor (ECF subfamily)